MIGVPAEIARPAINTCFEKVKERGRFEIGQSVSDLLAGFDCRIGSVERKWVSKYLGWACWFYGERHFSFQQIIFPNTSGVWPWQGEADDWFRQRQPVLGRAW